MSDPDSIVAPHNEDLEASKKLLSPASTTNGANGANGGSNEDPGCLIDAKPPDDIKHLIAKDESTLNKSCDGTGSESKASPISTLLDTMGIADLCTKYYISL